MDDFIDYEADKEYADNKKRNNKKMKYNRYYDEDQEVMDQKYDGALMKSLANIKVLLIY